MALLLQDGGNEGGETEKCNFRETMTIRLKAKCLNRINIYISYYYMIILFLSIFFWKSGASIAFVHCIVGPKLTTIAMHTVIQLM